MRRLIDTHSHIFLEEFVPDLPDALTRAGDVGVDTFVMPNINMASLPDLLRVREAYGGCCHATVGLHPTDLTDGYEAELDEMERLLEEDQATEGPHLFKAIGETGLDLYWERDGLERQVISLVRQVEWALRFDLPVIIHSRAASVELVEVLEGFRGSALKGVFHCFSGDAEEARRLLEFEGFMFGIGGVVTYRNSRLPESLPLIPRDRVVTETDCPYLPPVPYRGRRNEPAFMVKTAEAIAGLWGCTADEVAERTVDNACLLFGIQ